MYFRRLQPSALQRVTLSQLGGLDRRDRTAQGSFAAMENLCADGYPAARVRPERGTVTTLSTPGGLAAREALIWVDGSRLFVGGHEVGLTLSQGEKQLVSMGAYLVIWPDRKWINLRDLSSFGSLDNVVTTQGQATITLCRADGSSYSDYTVSAQAPAEPREGALWLDVSEGAVLRRYGDGAWSEAAEVCVKLAADGVGVGFRAGDGVEISGCEEESLNGLQVLRLVQEDMIVFSGTVAGQHTQTAGVTVARTAPQMDYITECGNRLWGCKYGVVNGRAVNEIYASKLGDFRNWQCYEGLSTDSYAASRGSDGIFTGAVSYLGSVLLFKENAVERVYPSAAGAHRIVSMDCPGVLPGSAGSLCVVEGTLFYLGRGGVYAFDGSLPVLVSRQLGSAVLSGGVGGGLGERYYLSAADGSGRSLLVYDTARGLWHRQSDPEAMAFAALGGELYCLCRDGRLLALLGSQGTKESAVSWQAETGDLGLDSAHQKYPVRLSLRLGLERGSRVQAYLSGDGGRTWQARGGAVTGTGALQAMTLHLPTRRAPQWRLRLTGTGGGAVYSISAVYEKGSDEA